ncbi:PREDICTED: putative defensin-like protein 142 [Camelina sativa]|uniref:Defensin-like protein 142 n=1 Tax=Camelina sativa TaxID=90675 RepID=A0ABM1QUF4_CAMSA|nr:PREDICTED: putative defensin-like protein 142 [Camelina sativa]XP_019090393.1 PREDICTED: putative defensin-like protein 142 [Camelina sativa]
MGYMQFLYLCKLFSFCLLIYFLNTINLFLSFKMKKLFLLTFTVLFIFTVLVIGTVQEKLTTCNRFLPKKPGKCVKEDCDRLCKKKWPKTIVGRCWLPTNATQCLCQLCGTRAGP